MIKIYHIVAGKKGMNALDDYFSTADTLAIGAGERLHDWQAHVLLLFAIVMEK
jgi:hypothetical protein